MDVPGEILTLLIIHTKSVLLGYTVLYLQLTFIFLFLLDSCPIWSFCSRSIYFWYSMPERHYQLRLSISPFSYFAVQQYRRRAMYLTRGGHPFLCPAPCHAHLVVLCGDASPSTWADGTFPGLMVGFQFSFRFCCGVSLALINFCDELNL